MSTGSIILNIRLLNGLIGRSLIQNYSTIFIILIAKLKWLIYYPRYLRFKSFLKVILSKLNISRRRLLNIITHLPLRLYIIHLIPVLRITILFFKSEISYIILKARLIFIYGSLLQIYIYITRRLRQNTVINLIKILTNLFYYDFITFSFSIILLSLYIK